MKELGATLFQSEAARMGKEKFKALLDKKIGPGTKPRTLKAIAAGTVALKRGVGKESTGPRAGSAASKPNVKAFTVGIWDVNSLVGDLELVASTLNQAQSQLRFFEVSGAVPAGLISDQARVVAWLGEHHHRVTGRKKSEIEENTIAEDFYPQARKLRLQLGLDAIVGLTSSLIAFDEGRHIEYNYFASCEDKQKREMLVSTYDLRKYARLADLPLEAAIGGVLLSIVLVAINPKLEYHDNTGCLFDFNEDRDTIVDSLRAAKIDAGCLKKMRPALREPAEAMVQSLMKLRRK
jgi:hypothetical protein